jgi:hypothetical protein
VSWPAQPFLYDVNATRHGDVRPWPASWDSDSEFVIGCDWGDCDGVGSCVRFSLWHREWLSCCAACAGKPVDGLDEELLARRCFR